MTEKPTLAEEYEKSVIAVCWYILPIKVQTALSFEYLNISKDTRVSAIYYKVWSQGRVGKGRGEGRAAINMQRKKQKKHIFIFPQTYYIKFTLAYFSSLFQNLFLQIWTNYYSHPLSLPLTLSSILNVIFFSLYIVTNTWRIKLTGCFHSEASLQRNMFYMYIIVTLM